MRENQNFRPASIVGPLGKELSLKEIANPNTIRWVSRRKAQVVAAIEGGVLTASEACELYRLSIEELATWQRGYARAGAPALRATRVQYYRAKFESEV